MLLYLMRAQQLFLDGDKRIGAFARNKILIENRRGIFSLLPELKEKFAEKLARFYEANQMDGLKELV